MAYTTRIHLILRPSIPNLLSSGVKDRFFRRSWSLISIGFGMGHRSCCMIISIFTGRIMVSSSCLALLKSIVFSCPCWWRQFSFFCHPKVLGSIFLVSLQLILITF